MLQILIANRIWWLQMFNTEITIYQIFGWNKPKWEARASFQNIYIYIIAFSLIRLIRTKHLLVFIRIWWKFRIKAFVANKIIGKAYKIDFLRLWNHFKALDWLYYDIFISQSMPCIVRKKIKLRSHDKNKKWT